MITLIKSWIIELGLLKLRDQLILKSEKLFFSKNFRKKLNSYTPIIIYQMGKVASASIYHSIKKTYPGVVLHTHTFSAQDDNWQICEVFNHCVYQGYPLYIITLTREPIGRNISAFFQNFKRDTGVSYLRSHFSIEELRALFLKNYPHDEPLEWFDHQIKPNFGIDVYASPFPEDGIAQFEKDNFRLLIIRSELDDDVKKIAIKDFLHLQTFELKHKNDGSNKGYANLYKQFKATANLPPEYISAMCKSKYFTHFYNQKFIEAVRKKWTP